MTDQLLLAYDVVTRSYDQGDVVDVLLLDFSKAFDKVSHPVLFTKLYELGVRGRLLEWIMIFMTDRKFFESVQGNTAPSET